MLCDSNILIYASDPADTRCAEFVKSERAAIASISRIEVLGFHGFSKLRPEQASSLKQLVESLIILPLGDTVVEAAIRLRKIQKMSLADSIIASAALVYELPLVTRNVSDFKGIQDLKVVNPFQ